MAIVYRVPRSHLSAFNLLAQQLFQRWKTGATNRHPFDTAALIEDEWQLFEAIVALVPTIPALPLNLAAIKHNPPLVEWLFLCQLQGEQMLAGELMRIHLDFEPLEPDERGEDEPLTMADLPFPTCGDPDIDTVANLTHAFGGNVEQAFVVCNRLDADGINKLIYVLNQLGRSPDDRMKEHLLNCFEQSQSEDPTLSDRLDQMLGIGLPPKTNVTPSAEASAAKVNAPKLLPRPIPTTETDWNAEVKALTEKPIKRTRKRSTATNYADSD